MRRDHSFKQLITIKIFIKTILWSKMVRVLVNGRQPIAIYQHKAYYIDNKGVQKNQRCLIGQLTNTPHHGGH